MNTDIYRSALSAGLSPLVAQIALVLADIEGSERAGEFIESCRREDEQRAALQVREQTVSMRASFMDIAEAGNKAA
ncbi:MAG TPA: hypothetical protein VFG50_04020 [Rhodothermales bacterium]|nr:hypothetical protein [Rhodothermales bacterium]